MKIRAGAGNNNALAFVSRHQEVEVYAGGRLIYYIKAHSSIYGTTTGTNYTIVNIPPYTTDITVRLTNVYAGHKIRGTTFEYGDETKLVKELIAKSLPSAVLSSFIIIVGFAMIILWIFCRKKIAQTHTCHMTYKQYYSCCSIYGTQDIIRSTFPYLEKILLCLHKRNRYHHKQYISYQ